MGKLNRRMFLMTALLAAPAALAGDARFVEPTWVKTQSIRLNEGKSGVRFAQFSDVHHKGDRTYLEGVVDQINALTPDFCCFTGDLVEKNDFLPETLAILSRIKSPLFGVPGNHDYWSGANFNTIGSCFEATGGAWLLDKQRVVADGRITLTGSAAIYPFAIPAPVKRGGMNILMMHYPAWAKRLAGRRFDLILAGHSHGGQVQIPFIGAPVVPYNVDEYVMGQYQTPGGLLYVNPGIGYISVYDFRFNCRPEITLFEV